MVRRAALKGAPEEAEIMQIYIRNYDLIDFSKICKKVPVRCYPRELTGRHTKISVSPGLPDCYESDDDLSGYGVQCCGSG